MDFLLNHENDVELDDRNDLATVEGRREIEQTIKVMVTSFFYQKVGSITAVNAVEKLELQAERVASGIDAIETLHDVSSERVSDGAGGNGGIRMEIIYDTDSVDFTVTE